MADKITPSFNPSKFESGLNTFQGIFSNPSIDKFQGNVILPLDFSLEMDGISGIIPNSAFEIPTESLPNSYLVETGDDKGKSRIAFILHSISQNFNNNKWTTKLTGQTLNIRFDELTEEQKNQIKKSKSSSQVNEQSLKDKATEIVTVYSKVGSGTSKKIKGIIYKNGEIPNNKLRPISNETKYKGAISSDSGRIRLFTDASIALDNLLAQAEKDNIKFKINSAYRTYQDQVRVRKQYPKDSAEPGRSNHGFGLAVDFSVPSSLKKIKISDPQYKWLAVNAGKFGFKRIASEAWHWEYQNIN